MTEGTDFPVRHSALPQQARANERLCAGRTPYPSAGDRIARSLPMQTISAFRFAGLYAPRSCGPLFCQSFRRTSQQVASGEPISIGVDRTYAEGGEDQTSVIVLVTPEGNVTVRAN